ncbi:MAG: hypothetical protein ACRDRH_00860 [Pseudonocardia sp.]
MTTTSAEVYRLPASTFQHWRHSFEEDSGGVEVFRPDGVTLPPAFGRDGFEMRADGTFIQDDIGPADGIVRVPGRWTLLGPARVAAFFDGARPDYSFEVLDVDDSVLRRRLDPLPPHPDRYCGASGMGETHLASFGGLPPATSFRVLDFDHASIITLRSFPPQFVLRVSGTKPYANMGVELVPLVYVQQPEYWGIEVVGSLRGIGLPSQAPYSVSLPLTGTIGTQGIEVIGASRRERFDLDPTVPAVAGVCRDWTAFLDLQPPGPSTLRVTGTCEFPTAGFSAELRRREPQGFNPRDLLLEKIVQKPDGPAATVITAIDLRYEEKANAGDFDTVTILPEGPTIPVQEVH